MNQTTFRPVSLVLLAPAAILLLSLLALPIVYAIYLGFTNLQLIGPHAVNYWFTGLENVRQLLSDDVFTSSLWQTVVFVVGSGAFGATVLGLALALLMQKAGYSRVEPAAYYDCRHLVRSDDERRYIPAHPGRYKSRSALHLPDAGGVYCQCLVACRAIDDYVLRRFAEHSDRDGRGGDT